MQFCQFLNTLIFIQLLRHKWQIVSDLSQSQTFTVFKNYCVQKLWYNPEKTPLQLLLYLRYDESGILPD